MGELVEGDLGSLRVEHEPPGVSRDSRETDVGSDNHVTEEEPAADEGFVTLPGLTLHDVMVGRVEEREPWPGGRR